MTTVLEAPSGLLVCQFMDDEVLRKGDYLIHNDVEYEVVSRSVHTVHEKPYYVKVLVRKTGQ